MLLATFVAVGIGSAASAHAATVSAVGRPDDDPQRVRSAEVAPGAARDALVGERGSTALLRRLTSDRGEPRTNVFAASCAILSTLALVALAAQRRRHHRPSRDDNALAVALIPARGPPPRLA